MAGKSWEFQGETKDWDNFWAHKFIRTQLVPGWSAQEGGPGVSSHLRQERTQTYLRRPCGETTALSRRVERASAPSSALRESLRADVLGRVCFPRAARLLLNRACAVMNPEGGPQEVGAADIHATAAARSLARVDVCSPSSLDHLSSLVCSKACASCVHA